MHSNTTVSAQQHTVSVEQQGCKTLAHCVTLSQLHTAPATTTRAGHCLSKGLTVAVCTFSPPAAPLMTVLQPVLQPILQPVLQPILQPVLQYTHLGCSVHRGTAGMVQRVRVYPDQVDRMEVMQPAAPLNPIHCRGEPRHCLPKFRGVRSTTVCQL
jgi:hypothetical protein